MTQRPGDKVHEFSVELKTGRSVVLAENGMVATAHPLATQAGLRVLREGGNAVDAAIAAGAATWTTMPMMCGPAGDAFFIIYEAKSGKLTAINGSGQVGARASLDFMAAQGFRGKMPIDGPLSAAIPGAMAAYEAAMTRFGTRGWEELLQDSIRYAESHPVTEKMAHYYAEAQPKLAKFATTAAIYLKGGQPPTEGSLLRQPEYAATLRRLAKGGAAEFYRGELGERIGRHQDRHGLFSAEELAAHETEVYTPLSVRYRGYEVHGLRPPSQGMIHLEEMAILNQFDLSTLSAADAQHVMIEAKKIAFADRNRYGGDPAQVRVPLEGLLSEAYARRRAAEIQFDRTLPVEAAGDPDAHTTYLCVVDRDGNSVSLIHSLSNLFGTGEVVEGTGLFLNNRAGRGFRLEEGHPNCIAPGKRTMHTLNCYMVTKDGAPYLVGGTPGGDGQPQWNMQTLAYVLDYGMNVQQAAEAPRWTHEPSTDPVRLDAQPFVAMESRFAPQVIESLRAKGHPVQLIGPWASGGCVQLIQVDRERGVLAGGSDPRGDGNAAGH